MKKTFLVLLPLSILWMGIIIHQAVLSNYNYEKTYGQLWSLADKSSTIQAKQQYISKFVAILKQGKANNDFAEYNALFLKTPNNNFDANLNALETLSQRLTEIQEMNPNSFEYNTAIQQITAQEQGEAHALLSVFQGCYDLENYPLVWDWIGTFSVLVIVCLWGAFCIWGIVALNCHEIQTTK